MPEFRPHVPKPVKALGIICTGFGFTSLVGGMMVLTQVWPGLQAALDDPGDADAAFIWAIIFGAGMVSSVLMFGTGIGLLIFQSWARLLGLLYGAFTTGYVITATVVSPMPPGAEAGSGDMAPPSASVGWTLVQLVIPLLTLYILTRPYVVDAFRRGGIAPEGVSTD